MTPGHNVRLTTRAHQLCIEEARKHGVTMKEVASVAISLSTRDKGEDMLALIDSMQKLEQKVKANKQLRGRMLAVGMIIAGCLGYLVGAASW